MHRSFDTYINQLIQQNGNPGLTLAVTNQTETLYAQAYGYANLDAKTPMQISHLMEIGSIGKSFTSIIIQQLHEAGLLDIHKPIQDYLDWFAIYSDYEPITIHHLLSHTAGIITGMDESGGAFYDVYALRKTKTSTAPGSHFHYSNVGYKALGLLIEHILQKPYAEIIQERILSPLGMMQTDSTITHNTRKKMAIGYVPFYDDRPANYPIQWIPATWFETATGDGCIASYGEDMTRYMRMYLNAGFEGVLSSAGLERMTKPLIETSADNFYGHGIDIGLGNDNFTLGHGGGMVGYVSVIHMDIKRGIGIMAMMNQSEVPSPLDEIVTFALDYFATEQKGIKLSKPQPIKDNYIVNNAFDYVGTYAKGQDKLIFIARDEKLILHYEGQQIALEGRNEEQFYLDHEDFRLFLLTFEREKGKILAVSYGGDWYHRASLSAPVAIDYPAEWDSFIGHYRCNNAWFSNLRIIIKQGKLYLVESNGDIEILTALGDNRFRVGDEQSPEFIHFDLIYGGQAQKITFSGLELFRFFTP